MELRTTEFKHVENGWNDAVADALDPLGRLVYRSNLLGRDWRITNTGGGNTSSKIIETDPLTGEPVEVLWVKGSGGDLRTALRGELRLAVPGQKLLALQQVYDSPSTSEARRPRPRMRMVGHVPPLHLQPQPTRACSIDTPLHSFIPHKIVDHTHPVACIAIATARDGAALTREIYGDEIVWVDWQRPGFELGLIMQEVCRRHPQARGVMLGGHGLITGPTTTRRATCSRSRSSKKPPTTSPRATWARTLSAGKIPLVAARRTRRQIGHAAALAARPRQPGQTVHRHGAGPTRPSWLSSMPMTPNAR